jgi:hypothetical protein
MDLLDVAREVGAVSGAFDGVVEATRTMLAAIDGMRASIISGWTGMIEDLRVSQMDETGQQDYFLRMVEMWMANLGDATTLEGIDEANANLMRYIQELMGVVDLGAMFDETSGTTWAQWIEMMMQQASDTASDQLDAAEDVVRTAYEEMVERLNAASDALLNFTEALVTDDTGGDYGGPGDGPEDRGPWIEHLNVRSETALNLSVNIDGTPLYNLVRNLVNETMDANYTTGQPPVIE